MEDGLHELEVLREDDHGVVPDVSDACSDAVVVAVVGSQQFVAFLADADLVLTVDSEGADVPLGRTAPVPDLELHGERPHGPLLPVHSREVSEHPSFTFSLLVVILLSIVGTGGQETGDEHVEDLEVPVDVVGVLLCHAEAHVRRKIGGSMPDAPDLLPGMDLLDQPTRVLSPELRRVDASVAENVEVRREFPLRFLLTPGVEDCDSSRGTEGHHGVVDMPAEVVELRLGLAEPLHEVLRWGDDPVADVSDIDCLLLAENLVREELLLDLNPALQGGVVHAFRATKRPTMPALALAVVLGILQTRRVHDAPCGGADEATALPVGTTEVVSGHAPGDVLAVGPRSFLHGSTGGTFLNLLKSFLTLVPDVILRMKSKVLYGRIRGALYGQVPHIGCDGVLSEGGLDGKSLPLLDFELPLERAEAHLLESDVVVFDLHVIFGDGAAVPPREGGRRALGVRRARPLGLFGFASVAELPRLRVGQGRLGAVRDDGRVRRGRRREMPGTAPSFTLRVVLSGGHQVDYPHRFVPEPRAVVGDAVEMLGSADGGSHRGVEPPLAEELH